jgi:hypothetical protein
MTLDRRQLADRGAPSDRLLLPFEAVEAILGLELSVYLRQIY